VNMHEDNVECVGHGRKIAPIAKLDRPAQHHKHRQKYGLAVNRKGSLPKGTL
jgi:hypothetical protein